MWTHSNIVTSQSFKVKGYFSKTTTMISVRNNIKSEGQTFLVFFSQQMTVWIAVLVSIFVAEVAFRP